MIKLQNEIVKEHLNKFKKSQDEEARVLKNHRDEEKIVNQARRTHYLLSTAQISGVYDPRVKNGRQRQPMEQMLRTVKPLGPLERKVKLPPLGQDARVQKVKNENSANLVFAEFSIFAHFFQFCVFKF